MKPIKTRRKLRKQRKSRKIKGGTKINIEEFVAKLRAMVPFIEQRRADGMPDAVLVSEVQQTYGELLHAKCARADYPTVEEHLHNIKFLLSEFDKKYADATNLQRDSMEHQDSEMFPSSGSCLDAKLAWFTGFLVGQDIGITTHNKNAQISYIMSAAFKELSAFLNSKPSRYEYEDRCNKNRVLQDIIRNPDINKAIQKGIVHPDEVRDMFETIQLDYFENGFFADGPVPPIVAMAEPANVQVIGRQTLPFIAQGSQILDAQNNVIGRVVFNNYFKQWVSVIRPNGTNFMLQLVPGMKIGSP
uniref:Uncharacterized protein n=1 Tax=viral metagenome TaxID=1070528 RepID=A0A6C0B8N6_9ZZZZ